MTGSDQTTTIAFFPEPGAWGPTNNCVAIANVLRERGHRVVFVVDESFRGELDKRGFEERVMRMAPAEEAADSDRRPVGGVHPRHGSRVPQADDRADRDRHEADLGGARRRARGTRTSGSWRSGTTSIPTSSAPTT